MNRTPDGLSPFSLKAPFRVRYLLLVVFLLGSSDILYAQQEGDPESLRAWFIQADSTLLYGIYTIDQPLVTGYLLTAHRTAYPVFYGGVPAAWVGTWLSGSDQWRAPYALMLTEGTAYLAQLGLKALTERPRPYLTYNSIRSRTDAHPTPNIAYSFPSGHATTAFAMATSVSLSYPYWYVITPAALWASGVALSRPWLGVHYPSDIIAGAVLGTAIGIGIHFLTPHIMPPLLE